VAELKRERGLLRSSEPRPDISATTCRGRIEDSLTEGIALTLWKASSRDGNFAGRLGDYHDVTRFRWFCRTPHGLDLTCTFLAERDKEYLILL
jgi:hypothetical protein